MVECGGKVQDDKSGAIEGTADNIRITSYNVCYTKLLRKVIDKVNRVLLEQRPTEQYRAAYERWLDPNSIVEYRRAYVEVFLKTVPENGL